MLYRLLRTLGVYSGGRAARMAASSSSSSSSLLCRLPTGCEHPPYVSWCATRPSNITTATSILRCDPPIPICRVQGRCAGRQQGQHIVTMELRITGKNSHLTNSKRKQLSLRFPLAVASNGVLPCSGRWSAGRRPIAATVASDVSAASPCSPPPQASSQPEGRRPGPRRRAGSPSSSPAAAGAQGPAARNKQQRLSAAVLSAISSLYCHHPHCPCGPGHTYLVRRSEQGNGKQQQCRQPSWYVRGSGGALVG